MDKKIAGLMTALAAFPALADELSDAGSAPPTDVLVTASRLGSGVVGASTTVITAEDIAQDPGADLPTVLARQAGVQMFNLFGGVDGAQTSIGLRGFGATATQNTLVLVNGRRINDPDQSSIDFAAIPESSIERIEITRGNAGAVLYGDGAVGGVINIVTKNGSNSPTGSSFDTSFGSYQTRSVDISTNQRIGDTTLTFFGGDEVSNGYRDNNALRERNFDAEIRQAIGSGEVYLNIRGDDQYLGLPGALDQSTWKIAPKTTDTPGNFGGLQSFNLSLGGTQRLTDGVELVFDAGLRQKQEPTNYQFYGDFYRIDLTTVSLTPRLLIEQPLFGLDSKITTGVDIYQYFYKSAYSLEQGQPSFDTHLLSQRTMAIYGEDSVSLSSDTTLGFGLRLQQADVAARERVDPTAPGYYGSAPGTPLNQTDNEYAANLGLEHRLDQHWSVFAGLSHAMRLPNMDDRNYVVVYPTNFVLKTQTSVEADMGASFTFGPVSGQTSLYGMNLHNEIDYDPGANGGMGANVNLAPTRRYGSETEAHWAVTSSFRLNATVSVVKSEFREGPYKGREVPQVSILTGNAGASWDILRDYLTLDADVREAGGRELGDDFTGQDPASRSITTVDAKIGGKLDRLHWSVAAHNLFDTHSYDVGYAGFAPGQYSVYPLPGRDVIGRLGVSF